MPKYFIYARKSTDVEDKQVLSIDSQLNELRAFADRESLSVVEELVEKQSAKSPGRRVFNRMLDRIEAGEALGILAWHPDRLARNSIDAGRIIYLLDQNRLQSLKFPRTWFENTPQGKLMLHNEFGFSKYYVDSLSENTKRGLREKVRRGECPGLAPIGYLNDYRVKKVILDPLRAPFVAEAFKRYATGCSTVSDLADFFAESGVLSRTGKKLTGDSVSKLLRNPIYYGHFRYSGEIHQGTHEPLITKDLFDKVAQVLDSRWKWSPKLKKGLLRPFLRLMRCSECASGITAEVQKSHTYYRCTKKTKAKSCSQPYIREEDLDRELTSLLMPFSLREDWANAMLQRAEEEKKTDAHAASIVCAEKDVAIAQLNDRLQRLLEPLLDGIIDRTTYLKEKTSVMGQIQTLKEQMSALRNGRSVWLEPFREWINTAKNVATIATSGSKFDKGVLASKIFGSNLVLDRKKAHGSCLKPWSLLIEFHQPGDLVPFYDASRTCFQRQARSPGTEKACHRSGRFVSRLGKNQSVPGRA